MKYALKSILGSFLRTLGRILCYLLIGVVIVYFSGFLNIGNVHALSNLEAFSNLTISENGKFYNLTPNGISNSLGYKLIKSDPFYYSLPSSDMMLGPSYGAEGLAFTQCDLNFEKDVYYTMNYYFLDSANAYIYPSYSKYPYKMGIHANVDAPVLNFNGDWYSGSISVETQASLSLLHSFTISFKAPNNGACITTALNTNKNTNLYQYAFIGYTIKNFGFKAPSTADIKKDLEGSFNQINSNLKDIENHLNGNINASTGSINNNIDAAEDHLNNNINASTNVIMGNIDDMQAQATKEHKEAEETRKGIWGTIKSIFSSITELPSKIANFLIDGLKSLFIPKDMGFINNLLDSLENKLGLIAEVPIQCIEFILNLASASWQGFTSVSLPSISIFGYNFWNAQEIDISDGIAIFSSFKYVTDVICVSICVRTLFKWYENFTGGSDS